LTDCRPISLFHIATATHIGSEVGAPVDPRRFRANIYMTLDSTEAFGENDLVGRTLRIGPEAAFSLLERDNRCKMITLDPDTAEKSPQLLKTVAQMHDGTAGVYGSVVAEGRVRKGDTVTLVD